jgi:hypothetical protein
MGVKTFLFSGKLPFSGKRKPAGQQTGRMYIREDYSSAP